MKNDCFPQKPKKVKFARQKLAGRAKNSLLAMGNLDTNWEQIVLYLMII